jgi:hypothetical protein
VTAVYSKVVSRDYIRTKLPDGSYKPETYFLKNGGRYDKVSGDPSMDNTRFPDIARVVAEQLGTQNFRPAADPKTGNLIIVLYWGTSITPASGTAYGMEQPQHITQELNGEHVTLYDDNAIGQTAFDQADREETDLRTAAMLGYVGYDWGRLPAKLRSVKSGNELNELEINRYFVVLLAYDCQVFLKEKTKKTKYKELWETRLSISTRNIDFTKALTVMAKDGSGYFGLDSHGLQHLPEGRVNVGEPKSLGEVEPPLK